MLPRTFRGRTYLKQGKFANAAEDFAAAIHLNPLDWVAYYHRGCLLRTLDPKQALQDLSVSGMTRGFSSISVQDPFGEGQLVWDPPKVMPRPKLTSSRK